MTKFKMILAVSCITLSSVACRSQNVMVFEPQVEAPEVAGRSGEIGARARVTPARSMRPARYPDTRPPNLSLRTEETEQAVALLGAEIGLGSRFDVGVSGGPGVTESGCAALAGKYQAYGPSRVTAKAGDLAVGLAAHANACQAQDDGTNAGPAGLATYPWKTKSASLGFDVGASVGYHVMDQLMIYGGLALGTTQAETKVTQGQTSDSKGGTYSSHANGEAQTVAVGVNFGGPSVWVNLLATYARNNADFINPGHTSAAVGAGVQF